MKSTELISLLLVVAVICSLPVSAVMNTPVHLLSEHNLSIGLDSKFKIIPSGIGAPGNGGFVSDSFLITSTGPRGLANLNILSVPNETSKSLGSELIIQMISAGAISASGNQVLGNWTTVDAQGQNVTIQTIPTNESSLSYSFGKRTDFAIWSLGDDTYAVLASQFNRDITGKIISTLNISL